MEGVLRLVMAPSGSEETVLLGPPSPNFHSGKFALCAISAKLTFFLQEISE